MVEAIVGNVQLKNGEKEAADGRSGLWVGIMWVVVEDASEQAGMDRVGNNV